MVDDSDETHELCHCAQWSHAPTGEAWKAIGRIFKYLAGRKDLRLIFRKQQKPIYNVSCDADWAGGKNTHSNGCCLHFIGNSLISWRMYKIKSVCTSVFESEIICASETTKDVVWIVGLLKFMFADALCLPVVLSNDNKSCIDIISGGKLSRRTRHLRVRTSYIIEKADEQLIVMKDVKSCALKADLGTKPFGPTAFSEKMMLLKKSFYLEKPHVLFEGGC